MRRFTAAAVTVITFLLFSAEAAHAAPAAQSAYGFRCSETVCRIRLDLSVAEEDVSSGSWLESMRSSMSRDPDTLGLSIGDAIALSLPNQAPAWTDAELYAVTDPDGELTYLYGAAVLAVIPPASFGQIAVAAPVRVTFGYELGGQLEQFAAPADRSQRYWHLQANSDVQVALADAPDAVVASLRGQQLALVVGPDQSLLWFDAKATVPAIGHQALLTAAAGTVCDANRLPEFVALSNRSTYHIQGQWGHAVEDEISADVLAHTEMGVPLLLHGGTVIDFDGIVIRGLVATDAPVRDFVDAQLSGQAYVPFTSAGEAEANVAAAVKIPLFGVDEVVMAAFGDSPEQLVAFTLESLPGWSHGGGDR